MSLEEVEAFLIQKALARYDGNVSQAAEALGLSPQRALPPAAAVRAVSAGDLAPAATTSARLRLRAARPAARAARRAPGRALALACCSGPATSRPKRSGRSRRSLVVAAGSGFASPLRERVVRPLQTLSNLLAALREGDFSIRARGAGATTPLGEVLRRGQRARARRCATQRLGALEATALLRKVMEEIDVAVFAFDGERRLRLVNRAGERLLGAARRAAARARRADELGLGEAAWRARRRASLELAFPAATGPLGGAPRHVPPGRAAAPAAGARRRAAARCARRSARPGSG